MQPLRFLLSNLRAGLRLALLRPVDRGAFRVSAEQLVLLVAIWFVLHVVGDFFATDPERAFNAYGFSYNAGMLVCILFGAFLIARIQGLTYSATALVLYIMAAIPVVTAVEAVLAVASNRAIHGSLSTYLAISYISLVVPPVWTLLIALRAVRLEYVVRWPRSLLLVGIFAVCAMGPLLVMPKEVYWDTADQDTTDDGDSLAFGQIDVEQTYYAQAKLLARATQGLAPQRPGVTDLYFIGFAPYALQNVFLNEVRTAKELFDTRFDTRDRSVTLMNNRETITNAPLASAHNLDAVLQQVGTLMDRDEDVLFLFLTSHGSPGMLSVEFPPLGLKDLTAEELRSELDRSGIKWRVIVVSACYSGSFIDMLRNDNTLVLTAARADRTSFGCGNDRQFTFFGDAFINQALRHEFSFTSAFAAAKQRIAAWEERDGITPSEPQIFEGRAIAAKLAALEDRLKGQGATATLPVGAR
jgi:hypothetical protein